MPGPPPADMRAEHLASLEGPQEMYLERRVAQGRTWLLEQGDRRIGYAVIDGDGELLELFHRLSSTIDLPALLGMLAATAGVASCLYQSFDPGMRTLATAVAARTEQVGVLFRTILDPNCRPRADVSMRQADQADVARIAGIDAEFFADSDEIRRYLDLGGLWLLQTAANRVVGCGVAEPVLPGGTAIDIGMMVAPEFRRQGYGAFIVSQLKIDQLSKGLRPICGCAIDNVGSQRAIQKAGFAPDHKLLRFKA